MTFHTFHTLLFTTIQKTDSPFQLTFEIQEVLMACEKVKRNSTNFKTTKHKRKNKKNRKITI
jgi:hypothetical protein